VWCTCRWRGAITRECSLNGVDCIRSWHSYCRLPLNSLPQTTNQSTDDLELSAFTAPPASYRCRPVATGPAMATKPWSCRSQRTRRFLRTLCTVIALCTRGVSWTDAGLLDACPRPASQTLQLLRPPVNHSMSDGPPTMPTFCLAVTPHTGTSRNTARVRARRPWLGG